MDVQDLKRWHWLVLGAVVGALVGYAWSIAPPGRDPVVRVPMTANHFLEQLNFIELSHQATLRDVVVYPPSGGRQMVIGQVADGPAWEPFSTYFTFPFRPNPSSPPVDLRNYLAAVRPGGTPILAGYAWWDATWFGPCAGAAAGAILIGGIWPVILNLLVGAGFGRKRAEEPYDLDRFKGEPAVHPDPVLNLHSNDEDSSEDPHAAPQTPVEPASAPAAQVLTAGSLEALTPTEEQDPKDYKGEYYPVARPHKHPGEKGFTLIELLVVFGIIGILVGLLLPALARARESALTLKCASNLREMSLAMQSYLNENHGFYFWRGEDINTDGMDWYVYGGRETGNKDLDQQGLFNRFSPRPLNHYVSNVLAIFHCPNDISAPWTLDPNYTKYPADSEFDWVGNSYNFNANGYPFRDLPRNDGGLDGVTAGSIADASDTIVFFDASLYWGADWHYLHQGNAAFADGHVEFMPMPDQFGQYRWNP